MAKRFSDSTKWDDPFFADLSNNYKLLWIYMLDKCDHAGIFKVNKRLAEFCLNTKIDWKEVEGVFKGRVRPLNHEKWFISKFIEYQYGLLTDSNRVHNSIIQILKKEGVYKGLQRTMQGCKDKDKDKDKDIDKDVKGFWDYYLLKTKKKFKFTDDNNNLIKKRLAEGYTLEQLKKAVDAFIADDWPDRTDRLDLIYCIGKQKGKPDNLEKWLNKEPPCKDCKGTGRVTSLRGYDNPCKCPIGQRIKLKK